MSQQGQTTNTTEVGSPQNARDFLENYPENSMDYRGSRYLPPISELVSFFYKMYACSLIGLPM